MKNLKIIGGVIIVVVLAFFYAHIGKTHVIYDKTVDTSQYLGTGVFEGTVEQEFVCQEDALDAITAKCSLQGDASGTAMKVTVIDNDTDEVVAEGELAAEDITNSKFNEFKFDTVENAKSKSYTAVFEEVNADMENARGIGLSYQPTTEKNTKLTIGDEEKEGTLIIKTVTDRFDFETFGVLLIFIIYITCFIRFLYKLFK